MQYAAYVRVLDLGFTECLHHDQNVVISPMIYRSLSRMNGGGPLLPYLKEVSWSQKAAGDWGIVYLIPPTLRRLRIQTRHGTDSRRMILWAIGAIERGRYNELQRRDHELCCILREIFSVARNLEHLTLDGFHHLPMLEPAVKCLHLQTLKLPSSFANPELNVPLLLSTLASIRTLRRLAMDIDQTWNFAGNIHQPMRCKFECLEALYLSTLIPNEVRHNPQSPALVFASVACRCLQNLSIKFDMIDLDEDVEPSNFLKLFQLPVGFTHIHTLQVHFEFPVGWSSVPPLLSDFLLPLATLYKLSRLYLNFRGTMFVCTDQDIRLITRYWPMLTTFAATFLSQRESGQPSVRALDYVTQGWRRLEVLCLPSLQDLSDFKKRVCPHPHLRRIGILSSVITNLRGRAELGNFAVYLSLRFPNMLTEWPSPVRFGEMDYDWRVCHHWEMILELVGQARAIIASRTITPGLMGIRNVEDMAYGTDYASL